jgi:hypothetical protein
MAFDVTDPVMLIIISKPDAGRDEEAEPIACQVCRGLDRTMKFFSEVGGGIRAGTMFELAGIAHKLASVLSRTEPRHRGRPS